jgi:HK97 family phage prohead protease
MTLQRQPVKEADPMEVRYAALEAFEGDADGMTFRGVAIPYGQQALISGPDNPRPYDEVFRKGAFAKTLASKWANKPVPLVMAHHHDDVLGGAEVMEESSAGLMGQWRLSDIQAGREAAVLIRDRVLTGLSIGFQPIQSKVTRARERTDDGERDLIERTEARLLEVSLCLFPAYELAGVTAQRQEGSRSVADLVEAREQLLDRFGRVLRQ